MRGAPLGMAIAGALGAGCALAAVGLRVSTAAAPRRYSAREAIRVLSAQAALKRMMLGQALYGGGMIAASPLYALVYVDRLRLPLSEVGTIAVFGAIATTVSYVGWGMLVDRRGGIFALRAGSLLGVCSLGLYVVAPDLRLLWVAALASGLAGAAIDLGIQGSVQKHVPLEDRAPAMAGWNALTGARGVAAPILSSALVQSGLVDLSTGLLLCLVPAALGAIVYFRSETAPAATTLAARGGSDAAGPAGHSPSEPAQPLDAVRASPRSSVSSGDPARRQRPPSKTRTSVAARLARSRAPRT